MKRQANRFDDQPNHTYSISVDTGAYFARHPFTTEEVDTYRAQMKLRYSYGVTNFMITFTMLFALALWVWLNATMQKPLNYEGFKLVTHVATSLLCLALLTGGVSFFINSLMVGRNCPVNIEIDGVSYCSHLDDLDYVEPTIEDSQLTDGGKMMMKKLKERGRLPTRFEYQLIQESIIASRNGRKDILAD